MNLFLYDKSFEGLLTCIFDAYFRKTFPDKLIAQGEPLPIFYDSIHTVVSDPTKADRVWKGLQKKLSKEALGEISLCWRADDYPAIDELLFRYIRKALDAPRSIEVNFADPDVLELSRVYKRVGYEAQRMRMFVRFQKAADGTFFAPFEPVFDVLPLAIEHFRDRFGDQKWIIYDIKRGYGFYYDLNSVEEVTFGSEEEFLKTGLLEEASLDENEKLLQDMWRAYFKSISIKERSNPRKHRQDMPKRYWKYLTEKQIF